MKECINTTQQLHYHTNEYDIYMRLRNSPAHDMPGNGNELPVPSEKNESVKMYLSVKLNIIRTYSCYYCMFTIHFIITSPYLISPTNILLYVETSQCHHGGVSMSRCHFTSLRIPIIKIKRLFRLDNAKFPISKMDFIWKRTNILSVTKQYQWSQQISCRIYCLAYKHVSKRVIYPINPQRASTKSFPSIMIWNCGGILLPTTILCLTSENTSKGSFYINSISYILH